LQRKDVADACQPLAALARYWHDWGHQGSKATLTTLGRTRCSDFKLQKNKSFMARLINSTDFPALVQDDKLLVVDFFATWCGPCKKLSPTLDEVSEEFGDRVNIVKVDVDESEDLAMTYGIRSVPTVLFFKKGQQVDKFVGALPKSEIVSKIENQL
jgi:thioredoxin